MPYKTPIELANSFEPDPFKGLDLDDQQKRYLKARYKGKDFNSALERIRGGEGYGDVLNGLVTYETPTLRERWNKYLKYGMRGTNIDHWNKELEDIDEILPWKSKEEREAWNDMGSDWRGEYGWEELADAVLQRTEPNYDENNDQADAIIKKVYSEIRNPSESIYNKYFGGH